MFQLARRALLRLPPELAHALSLRGLEWAARSGVTDRLIRPVWAPVEVAGLTFRNRVGLAAGLDKDGVAVRGLFAMGFGFVEVGTVTPRAQPGNPKPRLFRLPADEALINRMGFNNRGAAALRNRLRRVRQRPLGPGCIVGLNLGKNRDTPLERAQEDYVAGLETVYALADYVTLNVSSPNTPGLRDLQGGATLEALLRTVLTRRDALLASNPDESRRLPIFAKLAPDLAADQLAAIAEVLLSVGIDGVIATNTTVTRPLEHPSPHAAESGGLSGRPLNAMAERCIRLLGQRLGDRVPIIGVGGIHDVASARRLVDAGASLVQLYTGFVYHGPELVRDVALALGPGLP